MFVNRFSTTLLLILTLFAGACDKTPAPDIQKTDTEQVPDNSDEPDTPDNPTTPETPVMDISVPDQQSKYYMSADDDLKDAVTDITAGMKVLLMDSKFYAVNERVLSVCFEADKPVTRTVKNGETVSESNTVTMTWASEDPVTRPKVGRSNDQGEYGILCIPGEYKGRFTVKTNRYTYEFDKTISLTGGQTTTVTLDFAYPLKQPKRKVGILGDSISTFDGVLCNPDYGPFYPESDPNVTSNPPIAVSSKERTYWWKLIYTHMKYGELDANSSWGGTRVVHEVKTGRKSGKSINAGFVDRAYDFIDPDIIIIHGGTNDHNQSTPLGEYTWDLPIGQNDLGKFRSAYIELIKILQNQYEGVQIIIIIGDRLSSGYESSTIEIANHFGIPYVNFVGVTVDKCKGSHPTYPAFDMMATRIYETCKDYLP